MTEIGPGRHIVDFGQNSNGWIRLDDLGPEGTEMTITYGEWLDPDGDLTQTNIEHGAFAAPACRSLAVPDRRGDLGWRRHWLRAAALHQGIPVRPHRRPSRTRSTRLRSPASSCTPTSRRSGGFECSDERMNRLHRVAEWSFRGNACEIPTDCPTRERSGWVGDWQIYIDAAAYLYEVGDWSAKWLRDLEADQLDSGAVTNIVPDPSPDAPIWRDGHGSAGWGDAAVHVPWEIYRATGRTDVLADQFDSMKRWVDFAAARAAVGRHPSRVERNAEPLPHERYLWDSGWHFGEWLEPGVNMDTVFAQLLVDDHGPVATAYLHRSADQLARIAEILGDRDAVTKYGQLAGNVLEAWRTEFIEAEGRVQPQTQANLVRALAFGLIPETRREQAAADLVALVHAADDHLGTGFLATPFLLPVLADNGHLDVAYDVAVPGHRALMAPHERAHHHDLGGLGRRATRWHRVALAEPLQQRCRHHLPAPLRGRTRTTGAGLPDLPRSRHVRVAGSPAHAPTTTRPHGRIDLAWRLTGEAGHLDITVPIGTQAEVRLPDGTHDRRGPGTHHYQWITS